VKISRAAMTFHPLATQAILGLAFYPINQLRVGKLKRPLARLVDHAHEPQLSSGAKEQLCPEWALRWRTAIFRQSEGALDAESTRWRA